MRSDGPAPVAIIGGGFSGTMVAAQLARLGTQSLLIDGSGRAGRGVAYSTLEPAHLLNVRAEGMSAWPDEADHFARRFAGEGGEPRGFAQRRLFGRYLGEILDEAVATGWTQVADTAALGAERDGRGWRVTLENGSAITASGLVLAIGNQEPEPLRPFAGAGERYIGDPWGPQAQAAVRELLASDGNALLIGTGLTMVDLALSLNAAGFAGHALALSRRGQVPRAHADFEPASIASDDVPHGDVLALWRWLRRRSAEVGWRAAVDSLRPHSRSLWQSFSPEQQRRFLRHARPWWDVHRHRIAPQVAETLRDMVAGGQLEIAAGRIIETEPHANGLTVRLRRRGQNDTETVQVAYAFNCTGPLHAIGRTRDPLLRSLLDGGAVAPDQLGIGVAVDDRSRASANRLWAVGPLTKGRYWEIIAVPDIREQAAAVAQDITAELGR